MTNSAKPQYGYLSQFPALSYHYGLSFSELAAMPRVFIQLYIEKLPCLQAEEQMNRIEASTFPHAKPDAQKKVIRALNRVIDRDRPKAKPVSVSSSPIVMQHQLGAVGIGVTFVDADGNAQELVPESEVDGA